jgi:hypothetical protein
MKYWEAFDAEKEDKAYSKGRMRSSSCHNHNKINFKPFWTPLSEMNSRTMRF